MIQRHDTLTQKKNQQVSSITEARRYELLAAQSSVGLQMNISVVVPLDSKGMVTFPHEFLKLNHPLLAPACPKNIFDELTKFFLLT